MRLRAVVLTLLAVIVLLGLTGAGWQASTQAAPPQQIPDADPPETTVKLIFIHHSTGENWLTDGYGDLGRQLAESNYFVSDTNYGWGPDGIGDRTDIPDWQEWFRSDSTALYLDALFSESGQNADYTRTLADPGGENQIIMFKSCFPNSDLEGRPNDPPQEDGWLTVGHAKYVYNQILQTFAEHPDKLFVVITAPPLSDPSQSDNARAFNLWLVNDWLEENEYPYHNVGVFDFYNVLTGREGHHTFEDGREVYQQAKRNTLFYPSDDDHPSPKGSQKATAEFIPLLNYFYNRWQADAPLELPSNADEGPQDADRQPSSARTLAGVLDDFEGSAPEGTGGWEAYWDESTPTSLDCGVEAGAGDQGAALRVDYQVAPYSWGTCGLSFDDPQDWSQAEGLRFSVHTSQPGDILHLDLYAEGPGGRESYLYQLPLSSDMQEGWEEIAVPWSSFVRVEWEENPGEAFHAQDRVSGLAFGFGTEDEQVRGTVWVDDLGWLGLEVPQDPLAEDISSEEIEGTAVGQAVSWIWIAAGGLVLLGVGAAGVLIVRKKRSPDL